MSRQDNALVQFRTSKAFKEHARLVAKEKRTSVKGMLLELVATKSSDKELRELAKKELEATRKPGRPWDK